MFRDFPLAMHQNAQKAAEAAQCARMQGKFWLYHDKLFANQQALSLDQLKQHAKDIGLDAGTFASCLDGGKTKDEILADMKDGTALGVTGTPAFFVNGRFLSGAQQFESFASLIDEELQMKGVPTPRGK